MACALKKVMRFTIRFEGVLYYAEVQISRSREILEINDLRKKNITIFKIVLLFCFYFYFVFVFAFCYFVVVVFLFCFLGGVFFGVFFFLCCWCCFVFFLGGVLMMMLLFYLEIAFQIILSFFHSLFQNL